MRDHESERNLDDLAGAIERQLDIVEEAWGGQHDALANRAHREGEALRDRIIAVLARKTRHPANELPV